MSPAEIGLLLIGAMLVLILAGIHVGFVLMVVGFIGILLVGGSEPALSSMGVIPFTQMTKYIFAVIPLFILMGNFIAYSGIGEEAYNFVRTWIGQIRGGLAIATVGACGMFAAVTGSSSAGSITMGRIAYPEMKRLGYDAKMALGCVAAGGTLGILIPPSMGFILVGIFAEISIGKLFMAGIIPGILEMVFYALTIYLMCLKNPKLGPAAPRTSWKEKMGSFKYTWPVIGLFLLIMGGIYGGIFTPSEAGGVGAVGALIISLARKKMSKATFQTTLLDTAMLASMIAAMIFGAFVFNTFLAITRIPFETSQFLVSLEVSRYVVLLIILLFYIILGMFFDIFAIIILTIPIFFPAVEALGFDPIWFGVILVRIMEIGLITPPFGLNLFFLAGAVDSPLGPIYRGVFPFIIADLCHVALLISIPALSTYLPSVMG